MNFDLQSAPVLVVGAGIMGAGIAQVGAQAGHAVFLFDLRDGAAEEAKARLVATLGGLVAKGKLSDNVARATLGRIVPVSSLNDAASARLVVEAVVEKLDVKRSLFKQLEEVLGDDAVLATNTSSISVTAIANGLKRPGRLVGMHFFNPVPLMKLVEVVSGLQTMPAVAEAVFEFFGLDVPLDGQHDMHRRTLQREEEVRAVSTVSVPLCCTVYPIMFASFFHVLQRPSNPSSTLSSLAPYPIPTPYPSSFHHSPFLLLLDSSPLSPSL